MRWETPAPSHLDGRRKKPSPLADSIRVALSELRQQPGRWGVVCADLCGSTVMTYLAVGGEGRFEFRMRGPILYGRFVGEVGG